MLWDKKAKFETKGCLNWRQLIIFCVLITNNPFVLFWYRIFSGADLSGLSALTFVMLWLPWEDTAGEKRNEMKYVKDMFIISILWICRILKKAHVHHSAHSHSF